MKISYFNLLIALAIPLPCLAELKPAPTPEASESSSQERELPAPEKHIRKGIITLNELYKTLEGINNKSAADAAAIEILKLQNDLITWGQGFSSLVPLTAVEQQQYEQVYLPIIKQINDQLRAQAARLHSAKYYDSKELPQVLIQFVNRVK